MELYAWIDGRDILDPEEHGLENQAPVYETEPIAEEVMEQVMETTSEDDLSGYKLRQIADGYVMEFQDVGYTESTLGDW
jgi:hypothetical protein